MSSAAGKLVASEDCGLVVEVSAIVATSPAIAPAAASSSPVNMSVGRAEVAVEVDAEVLSTLGGVQARLMLVLVTDVACTSSGGPGMLFVPGNQKTEESAEDEQVDFIMQV